ncbi:hypothetical protein BD310DRAFT_38831 [Dichomitus squalens]|uniref:RlpA-like double-psi beta-barrel-protein domain-containing protein-containing protein n=1 Tax=Dichomitus squalens TaxID=114155 RepID=A0A4Q9QDZ1_9APHY|nr:hypothetical protein BD310DRAFT_38831 [Dichomitus squalens]
MFTLARHFRSTLLCVTLASALVFADGSHKHRGLNHAHRDLAVNLSERDGHVQKRFDNTRFTYFPVGVNACGSFDHDSDFIVALNTHQWDGGSHCYEEITITYQGKSAKAKITDECEECPWAAIDLSPGLFQYLVPGGLPVGEVYGEWVFGAGDAPAPAPPTHTTSKAPPPPPTTTHTTHKTTSTTSTTHTTSTHHTTTSHSTTSTTSTTHTTPSFTSTSSTRTSSAPTATVTSWDTGNLNQFNLALIQLVDLSNAIMALPGDV